MGADTEAQSAFLLLAGTNQDLSAQVRAGTFREDLLARIDLWRFSLPALRERPEDIEPNVDFELARFGRDEGRLPRFNREGRERFLRFAQGAPWRRNFRDLGAAITRMATLAGSRRIGVLEVDAELRRLERAWGDEAPSALLEEVMGAGAEAVDRFDVVQLEEVIRVCRRARSLAEAGRALFAESRKRRRSSNDGDRLRKYLAKWGLSFDEVHRPR